jgi:hypothetical protein
MAYAPSELTSGNLTKQEATIQQMIAIKAIVSAVEISICKNFFIINVLNCLLINNRPDWKRPV